MSSLLGYKLGQGCVFYGRIRFGSCGYGIAIGNNCSLGDQSFLSVCSGAKLVLEDRVSFNTGCHIVACESIKIGAGTAIGEYVTIRDQNHKTAGSSGGINGQGYSVKPVVVGKNVWIGRGCYIGAGVCIGDGAVIGANSVVVKSIPANGVAVGAPAKVIKLNTNTS
ncbi:MAG: acyltransferase [Candidatus Omnitrophica bacterium]|nr:acyltransferase [Candidatus Omnitrophota bacterium]